MTNEYIYNCIIKEYFFIYNMEYLWNNFTKLRILRHIKHRGKQSLICLNLQSAFCSFYAHLEINLISTAIKIIIIQMKFLK